jgi:hypothetical protein
MASSLITNSHKRKRLSVRTHSDVDPWPARIFEDLVGIPDVLNEKLADARVNAIKARVKGNHAQRLSTT